MRFLSRIHVQFVLLVVLLCVSVSACGSTASAPLVGPTVVSTALPTARVAITVPPVTTAMPLPQPTQAAVVLPGETLSSNSVPTSTAQPEPTAVVLQPFDPDLAVELQRVLDQNVADGTIPGAVLAVQIPGRELWTAASGQADRKRKRAMQPDTPVRIASISKVYTAVVVLQLIEQGLIDINAPVSTWFPDLLPNGDAITVRNLLNHTSGLYDYVEDKAFISRGYKNPKQVWAPAEIVTYTNQFRPAFAPGAAGAWDYSSTNYVILGMIVEKVTGNTLAQEVRQRIFEPLDMRNSFFAPEDAIKGEQAHGYRDNVDQTGISMSIVFATANIVSSISDVATFGQGLLLGSLLSPDMLELMYSFEHGHGQYNMPELAYGNGIMRNQLYVGPDANGNAHPKAASTVVGHIGGFGGFRSALWSAPANGITIALGENQGATDPNILATRVFDTILRYQSK